MKILIVDDSGYLRTFLRLQLSLAGHEAVEAEPESLYDVLKALHTHRPDLLLTDYEMPGCNGESLVRAVREDPALAKLPVLVVSSHREAELVARLSRWDLCGYLLKPLDTEALLRAIHALELRAGEGPASPTLEG